MQQTPNKPHHYRMIDYLTVFHPDLIPFPDTADCDLWCSLREAQLGIEPTFDEESNRVFHAALCDHRITILAAGG